MIRGKMKMLMEMLDKKRSLLSEIKNITENLTQVFGEDQIISEMVKEKQTRIDAILQLDQAFDAIYKGVMKEFTNPQYKNDVLALKTKIQAVIDMDVQIRVLEERNRAMVKTLPGKKIKPAPLKQFISSYEAQSKWSKNRQDN